MRNGDHAFGHAEIANRAQAISEARELTLCRLSRGEEASAT